MNKGSIRQKGQHSWQLQVYVNGKRYFETVHGLKRDAQKRLNALLVDQDKNTLVPSHKLTVNEHLDNWYNGYVKANCGSWQQVGVASIIKNHFKPAFDNIVLQKLTPQKIQEYYGSKAGQLSGRTINKHHRILKQALKYGVRVGVIGRNPADMIDAPRFIKTPMRTLTPGEVDILFDAAKDNYFYPIIIFAVNTGMRQEEILGLTWRDIDLDLLSISVNKVLYKRNGKTEFHEPKTAHSRRHVSMTPKLASFMREYKAMRESMYIQAGYILGLDDLVFTNSDFQAIHASVLGHYFKRIVDNCGLISGFHFHSLRHTFASLMLLRGVSPKVVSEALGHASVAFTMDVYSHIIKGMQEEAMALLNDVLPVAVFNSNNANLAPIVDNKSKVSS